MKKFWLSDENFVRQISLQMLVQKSIKIGHNFTTIWIGNSIMALMYLYTLVKKW